MKQTTVMAACAALLSIPTLSQAQSTATRYPVVLMHGLYGYDNVLGSDYFYGIVSDLKRNGAVVLVPQVSAVNSNEVRGEQLLKLLRQYKATYGYSKFNLIGHSQGGTTVRYIFDADRSLVASISSVGTPHGGTPVADIGLASGGGVWTSPIGWLLGGITGNVSLQNATAALNSLSTGGARSFNSKHPAGAPTSTCGSGAATVSGVPFYSVGSTSVYTNALDVSDALLALTSVDFAGGANDGVVGRCSTHWGTVLKDNYKWNHLDQVNQANGLRGILSEDPVAFFRTHVNRLKNQGL